MTRLINPVPQFLDGNGDPYANGLLYVYEAGTNTLKDTYSDKEETTANTNPVVLDASGRLPNVWYTGTARIVLKTASNVQVWERDDVGSGGAFENFSEWQSFTIYDRNDYVYRNGLLYISITNGNQGNDPASSPSSWKEIRYLETYNSNITYSAGDVVRASTGNLFKSLVDNNTGNDPEADNGSNWASATDTKWTVVSSSGNISKNVNYYIDATASAVDVNIVSITTGDSFVVHNNANSTNTARVTLASGLTIRGSSGSVTSPDALILEAGDTVNLVAVSTTILEVV